MLVGLPTGRWKMHSAETWQDNNLFIEGEPEGGDGAGWGHSLSCPHVPGLLLPTQLPSTSPGKPRSVGVEGSEFRDKTGGLQKPESRWGQRVVGSKVRQGWR